MVSIDTLAARGCAGVVAIITGADLTRITSGLVASVRAPIDDRAIATDRVRYVGEPVAVAIATDRYRAEDALDLVEVTYRPRPAVVDPVAALAPEAPVLHGAVGSNLMSDRHFVYGDPAAAFAAAARSIAITTRYPRNTGSPLETYGIIAEYDPHENAYDILANFQGPFSIHAVVARALKVPGNRLRLRLPPDSGGSFGVKQGVAPYAVLIGAAARLVGRPVKWIEDRLEHLSGAVSATNRVTTLTAAVEPDGRITALNWDQLDDCGAYLRAPEPATLYRMHGNLTGAYDIRNVGVRNRVVLTNKTPTGLVRGFGGPQVYYPLERLVQRIASTLGIDPLDIIRRNLIRDFPYLTATGARYDSGDYARALDGVTQDGNLAGLRRRRDEARAAGHLYGIGHAAVVEPSVSNMGYITTVLTAAERGKAGPKNGAQATATIGIDPVGSITVQVASAPQGQGHRTVLAQVVADALGVSKDDVRVSTDLDTAKDAWSIASGNYSSRFAPAVAGAAHIAAMRLRDRLARLAASQLNVRPEDLVFADGKIAARSNPDATVTFARLAGTGHWSPALVPEDAGNTLRETTYWTPPELTAPTEADEINSSLCHGFIFDVCGAEVDRVTGKVRIDRYISMHDCGRILHPGMVEGQIRGAFAQAVGAALYEELAYGDDGAFLAGTFADYLLPTATEIPDLAILHIESPSPVTPLGAKGVGEGNCMSTPVCIANAVADALGIAEIDLPLTPAKLAALTLPEERPSPPGMPTHKPGKPGKRAMTGGGEAYVAAKPEAVWAMLLDPDMLASVIPGAHRVQKLSPTRFCADVTLGVGPVKGRYRADIELSDLCEPHAATLSGAIVGALGSGGGSGRVTLSVDGDGTRVRYTYEAEVGGKVAAVGGRLLHGAARVVMGQFFATFAQVASGRPAPRDRLMRLLLRPLAMLGIRR
ncbi:MAG: molybdopterin-dependent oxidoreductase [Acetobacteraceae bacterium]|nr:molybdopterin-dependent oxidoreductase [Acetobacteraceae bacterium]